MEFNNRDVHGLAKFLEIEPHDLSKFPVGSAVFYRSYSRPNENGYESWSQCIKRSLEGLRKLGKFTDEEFDLVYRNAMECKTLPSGRWMWCGGSEWIDKQENFYGGYNCTSNEVDEPSVFGWLMGLAMQGCGTGAVLEQRCIDKLPPISRKLNVSVVGEFGEGGKSTTHIEYDLETDIYKLIVGDSRQGWVDSYQFLIDLSMDTESIPDDNLKVVIDISNVRESGKKLKGFGGTANPIKLKEFYFKIANLLNDAYGRQLTAEECCLLIDEAAIVVVAGNVRRCLHEDTLVLTTDGQKAIKDILIGDFVITPHGKQRVLNKFYQGVQSITKIKLKDETEILATENHRLYVHEAAWIKVCDITDNDQLLKVINTETGEPYPISIKEILRNYSEVETYDIEVDIDNCFYANGILSHNSAGMRQFDREQPLLKNNLWQQDENGNWSIDPKRDALRMANHTRVFHTKPDYETIKEAVTIQFQSGEGAIQYVNEAIARANFDIFNTPDKKLAFIKELDNGNGREALESIGADNVEHRLHRYGLNPCFRGDMQLLTVDGYKRFDELDGTEPDIINFMGVKVKSKVWCSGEKETVCLTTTNNQKIYCTPDHRFLTFDDGIEYEFEAKDLLGKHLKQFGDDGEIVRVTHIELDGINKVYDFTEPLTHWGVVEGFVVHNCGEILGSSFFCNLSEVHLNQINPFDFDSQIDAFEAASLDVTALLNQVFENERWKKSREIDPIVGVSITGLFDFFVNLFGRDWLLWWQEGRPDYYNGKIEYSDRFVTHHFGVYGELMDLAYKSNRNDMNKADFFRVIEREYLKLWKSVADAKVGEYCTTHNLKVPNRCTTVQPSGSKSLLSNASPGWHPPKATRYLRRVTYRKNDPVALTLRDFGYNIVPSQSDKDDNGRLLDDPFDPRCTEWLVEIPVEVSWASMGEGIDINQFSAIAQFDFYMQVQKHYTAHNCFSRDTEFLTADGIKSFNDFNPGDVTMVLNSEGDWVPATVVRTNETRELFEITLRQGGTGKTKKITATSCHRFPTRRISGGVSNIKTRTTAELKPGIRLVTNSSDLIGLNKLAIMHGLVYGDGSLQSDKRACQIYLCAKKRQLRHHFDSYKLNERDDIDQTRIYGLPAWFKELPRKDSTQEYINGFFAGLFAADGNVSSSTLCISTSNEDTLDWLHENCPRLGIEITGVYIKDKGGYPNSKRNYVIKFSKDTICLNQLLREKHLDSYLSRCAQPRQWVVQSVEQVESDYAWCVMEPKTNHFTLTNNILVMNTSATLEMRENEIEPLAKAIYNAIQRNDGYISAALLARFDDNSTFPRLPFEPISQDVYNALSQGVIERRKATDFVKTLNEYAIGRVAEVAPSGCDSDACLMPERKP